MKTSSAVLCTFLSTCSITTAFSIPTREASSLRVVEMGLERKFVADPIGRDRRRLMRRDNTINIGLENEQTLYVMNASFGTPAQDVRLHLDTGSSDLWINTPKSSLCSSRSTPCSSGTFRANSSSSYNYLASNFNITYADGSTATGDYVTDTMSFGGVQLRDIQFGIGYQSTTTDNIIGIGYQTNEAQVNRAGLQPYLNFPAKLVSEGLISSNAYSLWLDDLDSNTGSILFGGVDTSRFEGQLVTIPIEKVGGEFAEFFVALTGVSLGSQTIAMDISLAALLDSGTSLTYLPNDQVSAIYDIVGAQFDETQGIAFVPCSLRNQNVNLTFSFSAPASISVPLSELVLGASDQPSQQLASFPSNAQCLFGVAPAGSSNAVLGDTFLRSAYVVYDLHNNKISLAQSNFKASGTGTVQEITTSGVPSAIAASSPVSASTGLPFASNSESGAISHYGVSMSLAWVSAVFCFSIVLFF